VTTAAKIEDPNHLLIKNIITRGKPTMRFRGNLQLYTLSSTSYSQLSKSCQRKPD